MDDNECVRCNKGIINVAFVQLLLEAEQAELENVVALYLFDVLRIFTNIQKII